MYEATLAGIDVAAVKRRLHSTLIAVSDKLQTPYPDAPERTPWTAFVQPMVRVVDDAIDTLTAEVRRLSAALDEQRAKVAAVERLCERGGDICLYDDCEDEDGDVVHVSEVLAALAAAPSGEPDTEETP